LKAELCTGWMTSETITWNGQWINHWSSKEPIKFWKNYTDSVLLLGLKRRVSISNRALLVFFKYLNWNLSFFLSVCTSTCMSIDDKDSMVLYFKTSTAWSRLLWLYKNGKTKELEI
jgi:hypothetical protein